MDTVALTFKYNNNIRTIKVTNPTTAEQLTRLLFGYYQPKFLAAMDIQVKLVDTDKNSWSLVDIALNPDIVGNTLLIPSFYKGETEILSYTSPIMAAQAKFSPYIGTVQIEHNLGTSLASLHQKKAVNSKAANMRKVETMVRRFSFDDSENVSEEVN